MTTTLPVLTETIDNAFLHTWYEIRPEAIDNILLATPIWAALVQAGCMKPQVGGRLITRTLSYDYQAATSVQPGDTLPQGTKETETMAIWRWKRYASHIQRDAFTDQENNGESKIKDYVGERLKSARDGLEQKFESGIMTAFTAAETGIDPLGLNHILPPLASRTSGTFGGISRPSAYLAADASGIERPDPAGTNPWWGPVYLDGVLASVEVNLLTDLKKLHNGIGMNQSHPNLYILTQSLYEIYEEFALDISQIIKDDTSRLADLGFEVLRFKGKPLMWSPNATTNNAMALNTDFIEIVYDPQMWFDMTAFKPIPLQTDRIAHILCALQVISTQLRRHGRLVYA